eukprot:UN04410
MYTGVLIGWKEVSKLVITIKKGEKKIIVGIICYFVSSCGGEKAKKKKDGEKNYCFVCWLVR